MKLNITNAHIIDPSQKVDGIGNIVVDGPIIKDLKISGFQRDEKPESVEKDTLSQTILDAAGFYVLPGFIDLAVHLKEPGYEYNETIATGTRAAMKSGFTSICCMPDTNPPNDNDTITEFIVRKAKSDGLCHVFPIGSISKELKGEKLSEMGLMAKAGCIAFSDGGHPIRSSMLMRRALEYSKEFGVPLIVYPEDIDISGSGVMNEGSYSTRLGLRGIPAEAEIIIIKRDIELAALTNGQLHFAVVSTEGGINAVREAKKNGIRVTCSTAPHYFILTESAIKNYDTRAKVKPPLRTERDIMAIKEGLHDGTIDCITSDHNPFHFEEKIREFDLAAFGISGIETAFSLCYALVKEGVLSLSQLVEKLSTNPARIFNLSNKGTLRPGSDADIVLIDLNTNWIVSSKDFLSKGKNTPFESWEMQGTPVKVIVKGNVFDMSRFSCEEKTHDPL